MGNIKLYTLIHFLLGLLIGLTGPLGWSLAYFVVRRETYQEQETEGSKAITNVAWKDMEDWIAGIALGTLILAIVTVMYVRS